MRQHLLEIVENCKDEAEILEYLTQDDDPDALYALSPVAANLLEWYDFTPDASLLELGAGCGTLTGLFLRRFLHVTAVEPDEVYLAVNRARNGAYANLQLVSDDVAFYDTDEKYDYVTLIGNLPYAISYDGSGEAMLTRVKRFLKPGGKLFIALPNKYGLKYLAGANEDYSLEMYGGFKREIAGGEVSLYTKRQLEDMITAAGYRRYDFYYPVPDYRLPLEVSSVKRLPRTGDLNTVCADYYRDRMVTMDEPTVFDSLCSDGMYEELANSFLIICEA